MKNVSATKSNQSESPKTPGGISKSLLTPCRRVGLSRNWKKHGRSPFISPLANSAELTSTPLRKETRKRKAPAKQEDADSAEEHVETRVDESDVTKGQDDQCNTIVSTPVRSINISRKKSRTRASLLNNEKNNINSDVYNTDNLSFLKEINVSSTLTDKDGTITLMEMDACTINEDNSSIKKENISKPLHPKSIKKHSKNSLACDEFGKDIVDLKYDSTNADFKANRTENIEEELKESTANVKHNQKSPKDLTKECVVVIQKKLFKVKTNDLEKLNSTSNVCNDIVIPNNTSQSLFDSDNDDVPLSTFNKREVAIKQNKELKPITMDEDEDFTDNLHSNKYNKPKKKKICVVENEEITPRSSSRTVAKIKPLHQNKEIKKTETISQSSNSFDDDDDDFDLGSKKTILIRKTYDKIKKPLKAKSTGSITQKDIDELKERIEAKKKILLAKAITKDTKELRDLIKKWQKGCQDALIELMELMKTKFPEKQNMDYSEILQMLKIPTGLVGYDSENDCFNTPDDESIILSKFYNF